MVKKLSVAKLGGCLALTALATLLIGAKPVSAYAADYTKIDPTRNAKLTGYVNYADGYTPRTEGRVHADRGNLEWSDDLWMSGLCLNLDDGGYGGGIEYSLHTHNYAWTRTAKSGEYINSQLENSSKRLGSHAWTEAVTCQLYNGVSNYYYIDYYATPTRCTKEYLEMWSEVKGETLEKQWYKGASHQNEKQTPGKVMSEDTADMTDWNGQNWVGTTGMGMPLTGFSCELKRRTGTLEVNPNGGTWDGKTDSSQITYDTDSSLTINNPTRTGYTFTGWTLTFTSAGGADDTNNYQAPASSDYPHVGATVYTASQGSGVSVGKDLNSSKALYVGNMKNIALTANWKKNSFKQTVKVRYQNSDGSWGDYSTVIDKDYDSGATVSWSRNQDATYEAASISYTVSKADTKYVSVNRRKYHQTLNVKWQKSDGTWTDATKKIDSDYYYGAKVGAWSQPDNAEYKGASSSSYTVSKAETKDLYIYRKQYTQIVNVKYQDSSGNWGSAKQEYKNNHYYGSTFSWSKDDDSARYEKVSTSYTVTGDKTTTLERKRKKYTQTIYYYLDVASGSYNSPKYTATKTATNNAKTWDIFYEAAFNAKAQCAAWGNVTGYHWDRINSESWVVKSAASTNSYYRPNKYRLNVNVNGGNGTNGNFDMEYGTSIDLGTPTRPGWKFMGWTIESNNSTNSKLSGKQFVMGYNNSYKYQNYMTEASVKIIANWQDVTSPIASDTILKATNPAKTTVYATVTGSSPVAETPWVNNNVLLTFSSKDNETGLSELTVL